MSEYIEIEPEFTDEPTVAIVHTNLVLTEEGSETYDSVTAMEEGSPVAQILAAVAGIDRLQLEDGTMIIERDPETDWYVIIADVSAALREFFL